jgi:hypothetical protein
LTPFVAVCDVREAECRIPLLFKTRKNSLDKVPELLPDRRLRIATTDRENKPGASHRGLNCRRFQPPGSGALTGSSRSYLGSWKI